jgi:two-component system, OmpR family, phosphate regulon sensor histidine kinase PhoR
MNAKSLKVIFVLFSACLLFILIVQALWMRHFYLQNLNTLNTNVYLCIDEIGKKLKERENLQIIKQSIVSNLDEGSDKKKKSVTVFITSNKKGTTTTKSQSNSTESLKNALPPNLLDKDKISISDTIIKIINGKKQLEILNRLDTIRETEINVLLGKMIKEIKYIDASEIDRINKDTLQSIIKSTLQSKGIVIPFEYAFQKQTLKTIKTIAQSNNFNPSQTSYTSKLNMDEVLNVKRQLSLQLPNQNSYVLSSIKKSLIVSILFSLLIMAAFYYAAQLILKQKKITEMKNDFINNMTHELKTPIATIALAIDSINNPYIKNDSEKFKTYTNILKEENNKLNNHVERVLQIAALDRNELQLHKKTVNLKKIIDASLDAHKLQIQNQKAEIVFSHPDETVACLADDFHLTTAFSNLIDNALKYSTENCKLSISIEKNAKQIVIQFKDNGIGIDAGLHHKVFEKFYRVSSGNLHDTKGFGLGLSYVKSIIEAHNGEISLFSEKGKGSTFIIKLKVYGN